MIEKLESDRPSRARSGRRLLSGVILLGSCAALVAVVLGSITTAVVIVAIVAVLAFVQVVGLMLTALVPRKKS